jgi:simple sugar transport system permease protein
VLATQLGALALPTQVVYMVPPFVTLCALVFAGRHKPARTGTDTNTDTKNTGRKGPPISSERLSA